MISLKPRNGLVIVMFVNGLSQKEIIKGRNNFVAINEFYPAEGNWLFDVQEILVSGERVVSDVVITDGKLKARAITFSTVKNGVIEVQKEFWPDEYEAPKWRAEWVDNNLKVIYGPAFCSWLRISHC